MCRPLLLFVAALMALVCFGSGRTRTRPLAATRANVVVPQGNELLLDAQMGHVLRNAPAGAVFFRSIPPTQALPYRLPDNFTLILQNDLVETFTCDDRDYGYYADMDNNCQIFHVCVPLHQIFPLNFTTPTTLTYSFICPYSTAFSQDALVCAYVSDAVPCELSEQLYALNRDFFRIKENEEGEKEYAQWGETKP